MTKQIFAFFFCFIRELNLYSPLTLSLILRANSNPILPPYLIPHSARELKAYTPPLPSPSAHLKDFVFIKPWFYHPFLKPTLNPSVCPGNAPHVPGRECRSLTKNKYHDQKKKIPCQCCRRDTWAPGASSYSPHLPGRECRSLTKFLKVSA